MLGPGAAAVRAAGAARTGLWARFPVRPVTEPGQRSGARRKPMCRTAPPAPVNRAQGPKSDSGPARACPLPQRPGEYSGERRGNEPREVGARGRTRPLRVCALDTGARRAGRRAGAPPAAPPHRRGARAGQQRRAVRARPPSPGGAARTAAVGGVSRFRPRPVPCRAPFGCVPCTRSPAATPADPRCRRSRPRTALLALPSGPVRAGSVVPFPLQRRPVAALPGCVSGAGGAVNAVAGSPQRCRRHASGVARCSVLPGSSPVPVPASRPVDSRTACAGVRAVPRPRHRGRPAPALGKPAESRAPRLLADRACARGRPRSADRSGGGLPPSPFRPRRGPVSAVLSRLLPARPIGRAGALPSRSCCGTGRLLSRSERRAAAAFRRRRRAGSAVRPASARVPADPRAVGAVGRVRCCSAPPRRSQCRGGRMLRRCSSGGAAPPAPARPAGCQVRAVPRRLS